MNESSQRVKVVVATTGLVFIFAVLAGLFWFDPAQHAIFPVCPLHRLTGLNCPGCGGLRAIHHLAHGRVVTAFHFNPLLVISLPLVALAVARAIRLCVLNRTGGTSAPPNSEALENIWRPSWFAAFAVVAILFGILRNLPFPAFAWMSP